LPHHRPPTTRKTRGHTPPFTLLAVSLVRPVYVERYVVFGQPALALLSAAGVAWLAGLVAASQVGRRIPGLAGQP
jgi:hypothetical protein